MRTANVITVMIVASLRLGYLKAVSKNCWQTVDTSEVYSSYVFSSLNYSVVLKKQLIVLRCQTDFSACLCGKQQSGNARHHNLLNTIFTIRVLQGYSPVISLMCPSLKHILWLWVPNIQRRGHYNDICRYISYLRIFWDKISVACVKCNGSHARIIW